MMEKKLGKISRVSFGMGGYDDAMFGLSLTFSFGDSAACSDFRGFWTVYPDGRAQYSRADWEAKHAETSLFTLDLLRKAKVQDVTKLAGIPIEATFDGNKLVEWRVLEEVL